MKTTIVKEISVKDIRFGRHRVRPVDPLWVRALADSIEKSGLQQDILVMDVDGEINLVAGAHRLIAVQEILLWKTITCKVVTPTTDNPEQEARLLEIDENLFRKELRGLDRMQSLAERKEIYLLVYPDTKRGVAGAKAKHGSASEIVSFANDAAEKIGLGKRTVEMDIATFNALSKDSQSRLRRTDFAEKASDIRSIAALKHDDQRKVLDLILPVGGQDLTTAINYVTGKKTESGADKVYSSVIGNLSRMTPNRRQDIFEAYQGEIVAFVKKRGLV